MSVHVCGWLELYRIWVDEVRSVNSSDCELDGHVLYMYLVSDSVHACAGGDRVHARSSVDSVDRGTAGYLVGWIWDVSSAPGVPVISDPLSMDA